LESPDGLAARIKIVDVTPDSTKTEETSDSENEIPSIETGEYCFRMFMGIRIALPHASSDYILVYRVFCSKK
jgi:hypothetical protein